MPRFSRLDYYIILFDFCQVLFYKKLCFLNIPASFFDSREYSLLVDVLTALNFVFHSEDFTDLPYRVIVFVKFDDVIAKLGVLLLVFYCGKSVDLILY